MFGIVDQALDRDHVKVRTREWWELGLVDVVEDVLEVIARRGPHKHKASKQGQWQAGL